MIDVEFDLVVDWGIFCLVCVLDVVVFDGMFD